MILALIFNINQNVVKVHNNKNIEFLDKDLLNNFLEASWSITQLKRHYLVLEVVRASFKGSFLLVPLSNPHLMIGNSHLKLNETLE